MKHSALHDKLNLTRPTTRKLYQKMPPWVSPKGKLPPGDLTAVGFTCGIGLMLVGAKQAGFTVIGNLEWRDYYRYQDEEGRNTFVENFPGAFLARGVRDLDPLVEYDLRNRDVHLAMGHPECLIGSTKILVEDGLKEIRQVEVGDRVVTHEGRMRKVVKTFANVLEAGEVLCEVEVENLHGGTITLTITPEHPVMANGRWTPAKSVRVGDKMLQLSPLGRPFAETTVVRYEEKRTTHKRTVYNLGVEEDESYVAEYLVVHNCGKYSLLDSTNKNLEARRADPSDIPLFLEYVAEFRPRYFVMDDLPGAFAALPMSAYHEMLPGYDLFPEWISNYHYGNIQRNRKRMFMIGALKSEGYVFRPGERDDWKEWTIEARLADLVDQYGKVPNHHWHADGNKPVATSRFPHLRYRGDRPTWGEVKEFMENYPRATNVVYHGADGTMKCRPSLLVSRWDYTSPVLTGGNPIFHPLTNLPFSVRERARIQGFPDDFVFYGEKVDGDGQWEDPELHMTRQTGKAMPVEFCRFVSQQIASHVKGEDFAVSNQRFLKPDVLISDAKTWFCKEVGYEDRAGACQACWMADTCDLPRRTGPRRPVQQDLNFFGEEVQ